jgi:hypothetical protein
MDWGIGWRIVPWLHSCSTYDLLAAGLGQLGCFEHSDFQQQESGDSWGTKSLDATGWKILVQLPVALEEIVAERDKTQFRLNM